MGGMPGSLTARAPNGNLLWQSRRKVNQLSEQVTIINDDLYVMNAAVSLFRLTDRSSVRRN
jgi:hypothetical protein